MASSLSSSAGALPTAALVLKASCDDRTKRLVWPAAPLQLLCWDACRTRLAEALQFAHTEFRVEWRDDDGDVVSAARTAQQQPQQRHRRGAEGERRQQWARESGRGRDSRSTSEQRAA